jgi:iron complex outermembrane recepter protein
MKTESDYWLYLMLFCAIGLCAALPAIAEPAVDPRPNTHLRFFDIPPQSLETALLAYAEQAGIQIMFRSELLQAQRSPGVRGVYDPLAAIVELLRSTGFEFQLVGDRTLIVSPAAAAPVSQH